MLGGSRAQLVIEDMKRCSKTLARFEADRDCTLKEVDDLEMKLANLSSADSKKGEKESSDNKITAI